MTRYWPAPLLGVFTGLLFVLNTVFWVMPLYLLVLIKLCFKGSRRDAISRGVAWLAQSWAMVNVWLTNTLLPIRWDIRMHAKVDPQRQYLVCANHQSWNDIMALMYAFGRRAPFFKFFLKQELIWVPLLGLAWWGLDYPFMKRYSKEQIARNPALKGQDVEATRKACDAFRNQPALILNFLEGTRFTREKHARQQSPYTHLLRPKSGGFAFALSALGEKLDSLLDVTIVYPDGASGFWGYLSGQAGRIIVEVRQLQVPREFFHGSYENDAAFRERFQAWISALWQSKDQRIGELLAESRAAVSATA